MSTFLSGLAKKAGIDRRTADTLGVAPAQRGATPPVNPTGPGKPTRERPAVEPPPAPAPGAEVPQAPLGAIPTEMQAALTRVLGSARSRSLTEEARTFGRGDDRNQYFNLFGRTPSPREVEAYALGKSLEQRLGRPPTVVEVKSALLASDFIDRSPESF